MWVIGKTGCHVTQEHVYPALTSRPFLRLPWGKLSTDQEAEKLISVEMLVPTCSTGFFFSHGQTENEQEKIFAYLLVETMVLSILQLP